MTPVHRGLYTAHTRGPREPLGLFGELSGLSGEPLGLSGEPLGLSGKLLGLSGNPWGCPANPRGCPANPWGCPANPWGCPANPWEPLGLSGRTSPIKVSCWQPRSAPQNFSDKGAWWLLYGPHKRLPGVVRRIVRRTPGFVGEPLGLVVRRTCRVVRRTPGVVRRTVGVVREHF